MGLEDQSPSASEETVKSVKKNAQARRASPPAPITRGLTHLQPDLFWQHYKSLKMADILYSAHPPKMPLEQLLREQLRVDAKLMRY